MKICNNCGTKCIDGNYYYSRTGQTICTKCKEAECNIKK